LHFEIYKEKGTVMEQFVPTFNEHALFEKKKKTERESIDTKYAEYTEKINIRNKEISEIEKSEDGTRRKAMRVKIKRTEIRILEQELEIAKLRDENLRNKKELKDIKD